MITHSLTPIIWENLPNNTVYYGKNPVSSYNQSSLKGEWLLTILVTTFTWSLAHVFPFSALRLSSLLIHKLKEKLLKG